MYKMSLLYNIIVSFDQQTIHKQFTCFAIKEAKIMLKASKLIYWQTAREADL